jgi:hypothetical protein
MRRKVTVGGFVIRTSARRIDGAMDAARETSPASQSSGHVSAKGRIDASTRVV